MCISQGSFVGSYQAVTRDGELLTAQQGGPGQSFFFAIRRRKSSGLLDGIIWLRSDPASSAIRRYTLAFSSVTEIDLVTMVNLEPGLGAWLPTLISAARTPAASRARQSSGNLARIMICSPAAASLVQCATASA